MLNELIKLIERNYAFLNFSMSYTKVTDWEIIVEHRIENGKSDSSSFDWYAHSSVEKIVEVQDCDITRCAAEAYIKLTGWMSEHKGGY